MEQMYLIEIFIDKVTIFTSEGDESSANKKLIIKIKFGPKVQFIIKEGQLAVNKDQKDDIVQCDEQGRRKWSRTIRVGKSHLFPSYPDTVLMILSKFPLEIEVWNDDAKEKEIFVGVGTMYWDTQFFLMLKDTTDASKLHDPLTIKQTTSLMAECCCKQVGEIDFILRLSALGDSITTEFQQLMNNPEYFVFRTNKAPSMFKCNRIEGDDPNFCMVGSLYETTTLEDPDVTQNAHQRIEVCTELQRCGKGGDPPCQHGGKEEKPMKKEYPINKLRMGDITGPCGNNSCPLAHKVRNYIRALDTYKKEAAGKVKGTKNPTKKVCGSCSCADDRYHRDACPDKKKDKTLCSDCGGVVHAGETCEDKKKKLHGTGATPKGSKTTVAYVYSVTKVPEFKESIFGHDFIVENMTAEYTNSFHTRDSKSHGCSCSRSIAPASFSEQEHSTAESNKNIYTVQNVSCNTRSIGAMNTTTNRLTVYNCTEVPDDKNCKCDPPKPTPPCRTFDCDCITEIGNVKARKAHKPYCPAYKHKSSCPVTIQQEDDENKKKTEDDEDEAEALPYGLPPIHLGPCPILGRPCSYPDGFARMYKVATQPTLPPSYNDAGKVCCSKEYERIRKAIKEYINNQKDSDYRCVNKFNVDTETRCCDKEQRLLSLMGRSCCGSHKMAIQEEFEPPK